MRPSGEPVKYPTGELLAATPPGRAVRRSDCEGHPNGAAVRSTSGHRYEGRASIDIGAARIDDVWIRVWRLDRSDWSATLGTNVFSFGPAPRSEDELIVTLVDEGRHQGWSAPAHMALGTGVSITLLGRAPFAMRRA